MRLCVLPLLLTIIVAACSHWQPTRRSAREPEPDPERATAEPGPEQGHARGAGSRPAVNDKACLDALQRWTRECYEVGLRHDEIFAKGGRLLVRWRADRNGHLLFMDFVVDSFRGWAINSVGETLADCVVARAREAQVSWSQTGSAPLRLSGSAAAPATAP